VYSVKISKNTDGAPYTLFLDDAGNLITYDRNNKDVTDSDLNTDGTSGDKYNAREDFLRRILNLKAYLRLRGYLKDESTIPEQTPKFPPYNPRLDYVTRIIKLLTYFYNAGRITLQQFKLERSKLEEDRLEAIKSLYGKDGEEDCLGDLFGDDNADPGATDGDPEQYAEDAEKKAREDEDKEREEQDATAKKESAYVNDTADGDLNTQYESISNWIESISDENGEGKESSKSENTKDEKTIMDRIRLLQLLYNIQTSYVLTYPNSSAQDAKKYFDANNERVNSYFDQLNLKAQRINITHI